MLLIPIHNTGDPIITPDGLPAAGCIIDCLLVDATTRRPCSAWDAVTGELVTTATVTITCDENGEIPLDAETDGSTWALWPNDRGSTATMYRVTARNGEFSPFMAALASAPTTQTFIGFMAGGEPLTPAELSALALHAASGAHVPAGGTEGQVLAKASATDYATEWVDQTGGPGGSVTDHTLLSNIGTTTHADIDLALSGLANTSGTNTGDQDLSSYALVSQLHAESHATASHSDWPAAVSVTELGYLDGVTAGIQTQLDGKERYHGVEAAGALSFDNSTHILTMASGPNTYWYQGTRYTTAAAITCDLDSYVTLTANSLYSVYFDDSTGTLKASASVWSLKNTVSVATLFWNGSAGAVQRETHNHTRDLDWHLNAHLTIGCRYQSGLALTNLTGADVSATWSVSGGTLWDEDLQFSISAASQSSPGARVWYQTGAAAFTFVDQAYPFLWNAGTGKVRYISAAHALTDLTSNQYMNIWVYGSGDIARPIYFIIPAGANAYGTATAARAATPPSLSGLGINADIKLLYRLVVKGDGTYPATAPTTSDDYRSSSVLPGGGTGSSSAASITFAPSGNVAATSVQTAIEELDAEKLALSGGALTGIVTATPDTTTKHGGIRNIFLSAEAATAGSNIDLMVDGDIWIQHA